jgi:alanine racemase
MVGMSRPVSNFSDEFTPHPMMGAMSSPVDPRYPVRAIIDLDAIVANTAELRRRARSAEVMAVVKANAYGHGMVPCAMAALAGGATWLGAAQLTEGLRLRRELTQVARAGHGEVGSGATPGGGGGVGSTGVERPRGGLPPHDLGEPPIVSWLYAPGAPFAEALEAGLDLGVSAEWALEAIAAAARETGITARLHLKIDTGLGRAGSPAASWEALVEAALRLQAEGCVTITGCWSHFAYADAPDHPTVRAQQEVFTWAVDAAERRGARFEVRHLANSAALVTDAGVEWDIVRPGLALYGMSPIPDLASPAELGLTPALTLEAALSLVKRVPAGQGVSYGHTYHTSRETLVGLVPSGYADGVPGIFRTPRPLRWLGGARRWPGGSAWTSSSSTWGRIRPPGPEMW